MFEESDKSNGKWPSSLKRNDWDIIIQLQAKAELEKRYNKEVQQLCKTACFGTVDEQTPGVVDKSPLDDIIETATEKAPLISSMVSSVGSGSSRYSTNAQIVSMKLIAILVILCRTAHRNNSNFFPLLIALYFYSSGARVDAITLLNHLGLSVSYNVLQKKLHSITSSSKKWIKQQATNPRLVGSWDNFEYRENVHGERVGDTVKFRSITMALWICQGWRIPETGLKQSMWSPKRAMLCSCTLVARAFGKENQGQRIQCIRHHRFTSFLAAFPNIRFSYNAAMPKIDIINCDTEGVTEAYPFAPSMANESTTAGNISVFEDLVIGQLGLDKDDPRFGELLTLWWGDLKTEVQMLGMKGLGVGNKRVYDRYKHLFAGLALWHL